VPSTTSWFGSAPASSSSRSRETPAWTAARSGNHPRHGYRAGRSVGCGRPPETDGHRMAPPPMKLEGGSGRAGLMSLAIDGEDGAALRDAEAIGGPAAVYR